MRIVFFTHPPFLGSQSMPRFATMLKQGMQQRGHITEVFTPQAFFYKLPLPASIKKWMGYIDQYIRFPAQVAKRLKTYPADTLFVFTDQALGPWIPLVANRPHVIHCHDFLAQRSGLGQIPENPTSASGKKYQEYIRKGYQQGKNFISVSNKTRQDLHVLMGYTPVFSKMVYNGLNQSFNVADIQIARNEVNKDTGIDVLQGYLLHIGGNQWYKNRSGIIQIYNEWRNMSQSVLPLLMIGANPNANLMEEFERSPYKNNIHFLIGKSDAFIKQAYNGASVFLFPSLAEGFGWPIAEAMASGCPVITTDDAPMTEVGASAAFYIPRKAAGADATKWAKNAALIVNKVMKLSPAERREVIENGLNNASRFDASKALTQIEAIYLSILSSLN
ncbi:glycosyltransferase [Mucilaginibacter terrae]|uniref:glycosyltransferase n=1 Tax=Mucilaginibacter terrae TaxID=1955052 RepID=UPI0036408FF0